MENFGYVTLSRQSGLMREMRVIANNIANQSTAGYRQEGLVFSEHVTRVGDDQSISMARGNTRNTSFLPGTMTQTNGAFDLAIEGGGFFLVDTPQGQRLTRAGNFSPNSAGDLVTMDGYRVLDAGGAPVFIPPDAKGISIAGDGTLSAEGRPLGQIGLFSPIDPVGMTREDGVLFRADAGVEPMLEGRILQGFLENSNVDPIGQIARMIEVQRAYEMGQKFLENEHERVRNALKNAIR